MTGSTATRTGSCDPTCDCGRANRPSSTRAATLLATVVATRTLDDAGMEKLVLTVQEAAEALGVSGDLVYELTARGELPCLRLGRRRVIPRRAIDLLIEQCVGGFDPVAVAAHLDNG